LTDYGYQQEKNIFLYQLTRNGAALETWTNTKDRVIQYAEMAPGTYTFYLTTQQSFNSKNPKIITQTIVIPASFVESIWFYTIIYLATIIIILFVMGYIMLVMKRRGDLKRNLAESQLRLLRLQMNPHFIFNALNSIQGYIKQEDTWAAVDYL